VALPTPEPGLVISYGYLWHAEYERGQEEGVKDRPCIIVITVQQEGGKYLVTVAPVTHFPPSMPEAAVEIPFATKQRLGLDASRSWVVVNEVNDFVWPGPDLRPLPQDPGRFDYGFIPPGLFRQIRDRLTAQGTAGQLRPVPRTE
jgi:hypothetical protein